MKNYYQVLGIQDFAPLDEVKKAYRQLAKTMHPDRNPDRPDRSEAFKKITQAYYTLSNAERKLKYDQRIMGLEEVAPPHDPRRRGYQYRPGPIYQKEKIQYSMKTKVLGGLSVVAIIILVIVVPFSLNYRASIKFYEKGLQYQQENKNYQAVMEFEKAISFLGGRSGEAGIAGAQLALYQMKDYRIALGFTNKGLKYARGNALDGELNYLKGRALQNLNQTTPAWAAYHIAIEMGYSKDSLFYHMGILQAFELEEYDSGIYYMQRAEEQGVDLHEISFVTGWCHQQLNRHQEAISNFSKVIRQSPDYALPYYYRGVSHMTLQDTTSACMDFRQSRELGYSPDDGYKTAICENEL